MRKVLLISLLCVLSLFCGGMASAAQSRNVPAQMIDAVQAFSQGNYKEAASLFNVLYRRNPDNDAVCYYLSLCNLVEYKLSRAEELMERAVQLDPDNPVYHHRLAQIYSMGKKAEKAVREYEILAAARPKDRYVTEEMSEAYFQAGRYAEYYAIARDFMRDEDLEIEGKSKYLTGICTDLDRSGAKKMRPWLDSLYADFDAAHPQSPVPMENWCHVLAWLGDLKALDQCADASALRFPQDSVFSQMALSVKYALKDYKGAEKYLLREIEKHKGDRSRLLSDYTVLGELYHLDGRKKKCAETYEKVLKMDPEYIPALNNYAYFLSLEKRNLKRALQMSAKTVEAEPDNPTYLDTYGWVLYQMGRLEEARAQFNHAKLYGGNDNAVILDHFATVLYDLGEYRLAFSYWDKAMSKNADGEVENLEAKIAAKKAAIKQENGKK